jgi:peptidoglycan/xylan/chitin deacetylase (PgdA/CDA1 family)
MPTSDREAKRRVCFRFDVDSQLCMDVGLPRLLDLAEGVGVRFTFYVSMGRAIARRRIVLASAGREGVRALSPTAKYGRRGVMRMAILNPRIGARRLVALRRAAALGHEIGLHGGTNHRLWFDDAPHWTRERLQREVTWGTERLARAGIAPCGFASPGAVGSPYLEQVLADLGYAYLSDRLGQSEREVTCGESGLLLVPVSILGDPGGVGYLEWARALGWRDNELLEDFRQRLARGGDVVVLYDHPAWAGVHDIERVRLLVEDALAAGHIVQPVRDAITAA